MLQKIVNGIHSSSVATGLFITLPAGGVFLGLWDLFSGENETIRTIVSFVGMVVTFILMLDLFGKGSSKSDTLTTRETEIIKLMSAGKTLEKSEDIVEDK